MTRYWHGGQRGLVVGDEVLPPSLTGVRPCADHAPGLHSPSRADRVYVTTDEKAALLYAAGHPSKGWVYEVAPAGELVADPDCTEAGLSFECSRATVLRVHKPTAGDRRRALKALGAWR